MKSLTIGKDSEKAFDDAFNFTMLQEVGNWNPNLDDVKQGLCETTLQRLRTGYVNHPQDPGGETKFGIAKKSHPKIDIKKMTLAEARQIYLSEYWNKLNGVSLELRGLLFDMAVNHGVKKALEMLNQSDFTVLGLCQIREEFYKNLGRKKPVFLTGWLRRNEACKKQYQSQRQG